MPQYLSKSLATPSSTGLGLISSAVPAVATLKTSAFDTQRRIAFWSTNGSTDLSANFTFTGTRQGGGTVVETITGSSAGTAGRTTQDFLTLSSVSISSAMNCSITLGTDTVGSTPWQLVNLSAEIVPSIGIGLTYSATRLSTVIGWIEYGYEDPTGTQLNANTSFAVPYPFVSTAFSTATGGTATAGALTGPIACWRFVINSSYGSSVSVYASAVTIGRGGYG